MRNSTAASYTSLNFAYGYFNRKQLFSGSLPPCLITLQRHKSSFGYFSGDRFLNTVDGKDITDEIALNPAQFAARPAAEVLSILAHEMVRLWQHHFGTPPTRGITTGSGLRKCWQSASHQRRPAGKAGASPGSMWPTS